MKKILFWLLLGFAGLKPCSILSQGLSSKDIQAQMVKDWQRAKDYTSEYLSVMPPAKYSAKAVDSIRSFAQQMLHLASANYFLMSAATGKKPPLFVTMDMEKRAGAQTPDSVRYYVQSSYDFCVEAVKNSDVNTWGEMTELMSFKQTRYALMNKVFEHQGHHRGQMTIYIRLQGIRPPEEKLF